MALNRMDAIVRRLLPGLPLVGLAALLLVAGPLAYVDQRSTSPRASQLGQGTSMTAADTEIGTGLMVRSTFSLVPRTIDELRQDALARVQPLRQANGHAEVVFARPISDAELNELHLEPWSRSQADGSLVLVIVRGEFDASALVHAPLRVTFALSAGRSQYAALIYDRRTGGAMGTLASPDGELFRGVLPH